MGYLGKLYLAIYGQCTLIALSLLLCSAVSAQPYDDTIELVAGQTDILSYRGVTRVSGIGGC